MLPIKNFTKLFTCGYCGSGISAEEKWKPLRDGTSAHYIYYGCSRARDRNCKNKYIREEELIDQLIKFMDKIDINELGMKHKFEEEVARFLKFQKSFFGTANQKPENKIDLRAYAKYLLKEGSVIEKRELLACMKSKLVLKNKTIQLEK